MVKRLRTQIKDFYTKHGSPDTPAGNTELTNRTSAPGEPID